MSGWCLAIAGGCCGSGLGTSNRDYLAETADGSISRC
jgi:hypothetical protein